MKEHFYFNRRERNGIFVLLIIMLFTQVLQAYVKMVKKVPPPQITYLTIEDSEAEKFKVSQIDSVSSYKGTKPKLAKSVTKKIPTPQKSSRKPNDIKKNIEKSISKLDTSRFPSFKRPANKKVRVDINASGVKRLQQVKGIGPVLSKRIVKYRRLVGGFHSVDQLEEVYGIDEEVMSNIRDQLWINTTSLNRINIFTASVDSLSSHFYVSERTAKTIKAYIASTKKDKVTADEILSLDGVWYEATEKAIPYLILSREDE